jgi:hypothetical protein
MNEKIKQLALDAGIGFTLWDDSGREMIDNYTPEEYLKKFALLIVWECIKLNGKELAMPGHSRMVDVYCEHFGIEL